MRGGVKGKKNLFKERGNKHPILIRLPGSIALAYCLRLLHLGGAQATDDSPPPCSVLCHSFQILPSITLYLHLSNKVSPPGISWSSSSPLSLRVPLQGLASDVMFQLPQSVPYSSPFSPFQFFLRQHYYGGLLVSSVSPGQQSMFRHLYAS